jgi:hypothetical protein
MLQNYILKTVMGKIICKYQYKYHSLFQGFRGMSEDTNHHHLSRTCCENLKTYKTAKQTSQSFNYMPWHFKQYILGKSYMRYAGNYKHSTWVLSTCARVSGEGQSSSHFTRTSWGSKKSAQPMVKCSEPRFLECKVCMSTTHDVRLPLQSSWKVCSFGLLRSE